MVQRRVIIPVIVLIVAAGVAIGIWRAVEAQKASASSFAAVNPSASASPPGSSAPNPVYVAPISSSPASTAPVTQSSLPLYPTASTSVPAVSSTSSSPSPTCTKISVRRSWDALSDAEQSQFANAVNQLKKGPKVPGNTFTFDDFVNIHYTDAMNAHGVAAFLPWHRVYIKIYEEHLQRINSNITLPYWDWSNLKVSQSPQLSSIWGPYWGTHTYIGNNCLQDGIAASWVKMYPTQLAGQCIKRQWTTATTISAFTPQNVIDQLDNVTSFAQFAPSLEAFHGYPHVNAGGLNGDFTNPRYSPNDPIFFLHHSNIDRLWNNWQQVNTSNVFNYGGHTPTGAQATLQDPLTIFGVKVSDAMDSYNQMCVSYEPPPSSLASDIPTVLASPEALTEDAIQAFWPAGHINVTFIRQLEAQTNQFVEAFNTANAAS
ncbi:uncharacterized protein BJ171DRAFT_254687 [Polychytrium aggregatum]|uniref:uncharacterized protein n=1 Tax=Polychytrium aggregatum TaxID=110093 RepID=UPI0022FE7314|nr:uncharacterized protein BJ171DRAFT_254687 [Polychytrium aggregatum]KAI9207750.1 hypothetical protein BJ171DRAFT_254687 [Polychytrium aggregatum]